MHRALKEVIKEIRDLFYSGDYEDIVPFVGAGSSIPLSLPNWEELVRDYHNAVDCKKDFDNLKKEYEKNWPVISDLIFSESGSDLEAYKKFMAERFLPGACKYTDVHLTIIDNYRKIITTNFDIAFEDALNYKSKDENYSASVRNGYKYTSLIYPKRLNPINFNGRCIAYLHGRRDTDGYVFRKVEYTLAYEDAQEITTFLRTVITKHPIIFLGFSFDDIIFKNKLQEIIGNIKIETEKNRAVHGFTEAQNLLPKLYAIINESQVNELIPDEDLAFYFGSEQHKVLDGLIEVNKVENGWSLKPLVEPKKIVQELSGFLGDKTVSFQHLLDKINDIKNRNKYFKDLDINVLKYSGSHTNVSAILNEIVVHKKDFANDLQSLPDNI